MAHLVVKKKTISRIKSLDNGFSLLGSAIFHFVTAAVVLLDLTTRATSFLQLTFGK